MSPTIYIDGDSCHVIDTTETIAKKHHVPCHIYSDTTRVLESDYSKIHIVDRGPDSVDFAILNACSPGDVIVTADGGLAALALGRGCYAISPFGVEFTDARVTSVLTSRYMRAHAARSSGGKKRNRSASVMKACISSTALKKESYPHLLSRILKRATKETS
jgi:hypothetical protein